jgi:hypothetical protein
MEGMPLRDMDGNVRIAQVDDRPLVLQRHRVQTVRHQAGDIFDAVEAELFRQALATVKRDLLINHGIEKVFHAGIKAMRRHSPS